MFCSICCKNEVHVRKTKSGMELRNGVSVCHTCYGEVDHIKNLITKDKKEKSISYPADIDWGKRLAEKMTDEREGWIGFRSDLVDAFGEGIYSDIQVKPGSGPPVRTHKLLLATRSEILKTMLASDLCKTAPADSISLPEFNHEELETFLEFLYRGELDIEKFQKHYCSLLIAADKYGISHLQKYSEQQLIKLLNSSNALKVLELSEVVSNKTLKLASLKFILLQYKEIILAPSFDEFAKQNPLLVVEITRASVTCWSQTSVYWSRKIF